MRKSVVKLAYANVIKLVNVNVFELVNSIVLKLVNVIHEEYLISIILLGLIRSKRISLFFI